MYLYFNVLYLSIAEVKSSNKEKEMPPNIVCSGQAGALPRPRGFCPEKRNLCSEFFLPIPRLPLTLAVSPPLA